MRGEPPPTWVECLAAGMTAGEAAAARGVSTSAAYNWARKVAVRWPEQRNTEYNIRVRTRAASIKRAQEIEQRRQQGESLSDIAKDEGVTKQAIFDRTRSRRRGSVHEVMLALSPDTRRWLAAQVPVGSSVAEMLAAIVTDAHAEDQEKGQGK